MMRDRASRCRLTATCWPANAGARPGPPVRIAHDGAVTASTPRPGGGGVLSEAGIVVGEQDCVALKPLHLVSGLPAARRAFVLAGAIAAAAVRPDRAPRQISVVDGALSADVHTTAPRWARRWSSWA